MKSSTNMCVWILSISEHKILSGRELLLLSRGVGCEKMWFPVGRKRDEAKFSTVTTVLFNTFYGEWDTKIHGIGSISNYSICDHPKASNDASILYEELSYR